MQVWEEMKAADVEGNTYVYVALINACERSSDWQRALTVFYAMRVRPLPHRPTSPARLRGPHVSARASAICVGAHTRTESVVRGGGDADARTVKLSNQYTVAW